MQIRHMEMLIVYLEWDHAVRIAQAYLYEALWQENQGRNYCLHEWMKDVLHMESDFTIGLNLDGSQQKCIFSMLVCVFQLWMNVNWRAGVKVRAWKLDWHIWTESIIDKNCLFVVVYKDNGLTGSTYISNRIRAGVKQTEWLLFAHRSICLPGQAQHN